MSNFSHEEELQIVKDAMSLTAAIQLGEQALDQLSAERFLEKPPVRPSKPNPPSEPCRPPRVRGKVLEVPNVPVNLPPEPKCKITFSDYFNQNLVLNLILCFATYFIYLPFVLYRWYNYKTEQDAMLKKSPEYLAAVQAAKEYARAEQEKVDAEIAEQQKIIDAEVVEKQAKQDKDHVESLKHYHDVVLPEYENGPLKVYNEVTIPNYIDVLVPAYQKRRDDWTIAHKLKLQMTEEQVQFNKETLEELYSETMLISLRYRKLSILQWLYNELSTSNITFERAVDLFDNYARDAKIDIAGDKALQGGRYVSSAIENACSDLVYTMMNIREGMTEGFSAVYSAIDAGNITLAKTRRDNNIGNAVGVIQRWKLNKKMKTQNEMFSSRFEKMDEEAKKNR